MELIAHIDVAEEQRIKAILDADENHSWPAIDCESMDGWVPDMGLTGYANYSIYRPPAVAAAGIKTTVRHRFRVPIRNPKLPGIYHLGALIYTQVGEDFPLEISLGSEDIGRIEPRRHDNRRHLIVLERPINFDHRVKWVEFTSAGNSTCRIENFVMLKEAPEPSSFLPSIERMHVEVTKKTRDTVSAIAHCVTYPPATVVATAMGSKGDQIASTQDGPSTLHAVNLQGLRPDLSYAVQFTATDQEGGSSEAWCNFVPEDASGRIALTTKSGDDTGLHAAATTDEYEAPVELYNLSASKLEGMPLSFGIPIKEGTFLTTPTASIKWMDEVTAAQARITGQWPDGSARWLLIDSTMPLRLSKTGKLACQVQLIAGFRQTARSIPLISKEAEGSVTVTGRRLQVTLDPNAKNWLLVERQGDIGSPSAPLAGGPIEAAFSVQLADGSTLSTRAGPAIIEHHGPIRTTLRISVRHLDTQDITRLRSEIRIHVFAEQQFVKIDHRLLVARANVSSKATFESGEQEEDQLLALRSYAMEVPYPDALSVHLENESFKLDPKPKVEQTWRLTHEHDQEYRLTTGRSEQRRARRIHGHVRFHSSNCDLLVGIRNFWQCYPKSISLKEQKISLQILPQRSGDELPGDEDAQQRLYTWLKDGNYLLREGMALSSEILLGCADDVASSAAWFEWLETPIVGRPTVEYANATGALPRLTSKEDSPQPAYERLAAEALTLLRDDRESWRAYGHVNFGDWYGEGDWSWGNNEYDTPFGAYLEFLRGGDPEWATWGAEASRHLADIDTINCFHDKRYVGMQSMHMPAHLGGYLPAYFRSKVAGTQGSPSHMWVEGPLLHYLITGDEAVRESITQSANWLLQPQQLDYYDFTGVREAGWHLIHLSMIAGAINDRRALNGASIVVERIIEKQDDGGGWTRMLTSGHCHCGYPHCRGNIAFMVTVLLSGMKRYYDLTHEERVAKAIVSGAHWLIRETFNDETGHFTAGSCKTVQRTSSGDAYNTRIVLEGIADAYAISRDPEIARCLKRTLPSVSEPINAEGRRDLGKIISDQMRYVPTILASLDSEIVRD